MLSKIKRLRHLMADESGPTAVEYAVMLAMIVIVCMGAIRAVGTKSSTTFNNVANSIAGTTS